MIKKKLAVFFIILVSLLLFTHRPFFAQELTPTPEEPKDSTTSSIIKYDLAYPGILPDHPLYKLKVLRDRISITLISDPRKKIDFYLLQTDKGILAAAMLVDKNKISMAEETALKAENNFTLLSRTISSYVKNQNPKKEELDSLVAKLKTASSKHQEILNSLLKRVPKENQKTFENVIYFSKSNMNTIENTIKDFETGVN